MVRSVPLPLTSIDPPSRMRFWCWMGRSKFFAMRAGMALSSSKGGYFSPQALKVKFGC